MTKKKIAQPKRQTKRAPKSAQNQPDNAASTVEVSLAALARWNALIARAQRDAIEAAPRRIPRICGGADAAVRAYDTLRAVRDEICVAIGAFGEEHEQAGGAS